MRQGTGVLRRLARAAAAAALTAAFVLTAAGCAAGEPKLSDLADRLQRGAAESRAAEGTLTSDPATGKPTYNLLLIGSDRREKTWNGNSDAVMLVTVNYGRQTITLTSFMRDLGVDIPGLGYGKLNSAYARGGAALLENTLTADFGVQIDNYAAMDFDTTAQVIDTVGGVDVVVTTAEAEVRKSYLDEMGNLYGFNAADLYVIGRDDGAATHLSGFQAVAYARNRYVGNGDFERTQRQREVMLSLLEKLRTASAEQIVSAASEALTLSTTDLSAADAAAMAQRFIAAEDYSVVENRVPYDGYYTSDGENLIPDHDVTVSLLQQLYQ